MQYDLSPPPPPLATDIALFLDFDGTLVNIAPTPDDIRVDAGLGQTLHVAAQRMNGALAVISGRPVASIDHYLQHRVAAVAGIHGAERRTASGDFQHVALDAAAMSDYRTQLLEFAQAHDGVLLEDKDISMALHFRRAPEWAAACRRAVDDCVAASRGALARLDGKMVVELKPTAVNKAQAVAAYMCEAPFVGRQPVFVGDDITDESAFVLAKELGGYGVIVGHRRPTAATAMLPSVAELHAWLTHVSERV